MNRWRRKALAVWMVVLAWLGHAAASWGIEVVLKDGRVLQGKRGLVGGMTEIPLANPVDGPGAVPVIEFLDDELRRTFFSMYQVLQRRPEQTPEVPEKFVLRQRVLRGGQTIKMVGPLLNVQPFDPFGRRTVTMVTVRGEVPIVQGITELTPSYAKVEGITHVWDMRLATSSIPHEELARILKNLYPQPTLDDIKRIARFYLQCERYEEAAKELETFLAEHAQDAEAQKQLAPSLEAIRQLGAKRLLGELMLRRAAGQHRFVLEMLKKFPGEKATGDTLQSVREAVRQYETDEAARTKIIAHMQALLKQIGDAALRERAEPIVSEIASELNANTLDRMAAFREMAEDTGLSASDRLALAISGWLVGSQGAVPRLSTALSLVEVRRRILEYFHKPDKLARDALLVGFRSEEGASPALVARVLAHMKPPLAEAPPDDPATPCVLEVPGVNSKSPPVRSLVQLPPEYDPHRRYPAILTLHGAGYGPEHQIDWWAGPRTQQGWRAGQASRHGYIVIAPAWTLEHQKQYQYSAREHAAVLDTLRAACQRFSIDTDRVFLTGHSMGGDAAWDIGLAHPDLWAGVLPIAAKSDKYCTFYGENAALVPFYFVIGGMDSSRMVANSVDWDRYLRKGYNTTVVEYQGRGHESFSDEILRIFDWMGRQRRNFAPKEFTAVTMRPWDNFFWWIELRQLPPRAMIAPEDWPPPRGTRPVQTKATVTRTNGLLIQAGSAHLTIWLSPEILDLERRMTITVNSNRVNLGNAAALAGDLAVMLEDARTRADRQHVFWSKVESPTGRISRN